MKRIIPVLMIGFALQCSAMTPAEIRAIAAKPHNEKDLVSELKLMTLGREVEILARSGKPGEPLTKHAAVVSQDKIVDGKYLVSEFQPENTPSPIYQVIEYDRDATVYRGWTLFPHGKVVEAVRVALPESRVISWTYLETPYGANTQSVSVVEYTDKGGQWNEVIRDGGKIVFITKGTARKLK